MISSSKGETERCFQPLFSHPPAVFFPRWVSRPHPYFTKGEFQRKMWRARGESSTLSLLPVLFCQNLPNDTLKQRGSHLAISGNIIIDPRLHLQQGEDFNSDLDFCMEIIYTVANAQQFEHCSKLYKCKGKSSQGIWSKMLMCRVLLVSVPGSQLLLLLPPTQFPASLTAPQQSAFCSPRVCSVLIVVVV